MLTFRAVNGIDDPELDSCGNTAVAVLEWQGMKIALCDECIHDLLSDVEQFQNTVFCRNCAFFRMSRWGAKYGGTCLKKCDREVRPEEYGDVWCTSCMDTCEESERKEA